MTGIEAELSERQGMSRQHKIKEQYTGMQKSSIYPPWLSLALFPLGKLHYLWICFLYVYICVYMMHVNLYVYYPTYWTNLL